MSEKVHDLVIVGAGPAALTAAVYAARYKMDFIIVGGIPGGNMSVSYDIDNYPGYVHTTGQELTKNMVSQLKAIGHDLIVDVVKKVEKKKDFVELTGHTSSYRGKKVLLAIGTERNKLNVPGEAELTGKGVSYCATCDGFFFKDRTVAVVGGGDSAAEAAVFLSEIAKKVYIILRRDEFRAEPDWQERLEKAENVEMIFKSQVKEIIGKDKVEKVRLDTGKEVELDGVFIEIGETPSSVIFDELNLKRDKMGYVEVDEQMKSSTKDVWVAGDPTTGSNKFRQIITACAEGAVAANSIYAETRDGK